MPCKAFQPISVYTRTALLAVSRLRPGGICMAGPVFSQLVALQMVALYNLHFYLIPIWFSRYEALHVGPGYLCRGDRWADQQRAPWATRSLHGCTLPMSLWHGPASSVCGRVFAQPVDGKQSHACGRFVLCMAFHIWQVDSYPDRCAVKGGSVAFRTANDIFAVPP
jgi:hypothetical protein